MGTEITHTQFTKADFSVFEECLLSETHELECLFNQKAFHCDVPVGGFELEAWLVDHNANPIPENTEFLKIVDNPEIVPELSLFNFEINVEPQKLCRNALAVFEERLLKNWQRCLGAAKQLGGSALSIGVHPTIADAQLNPRNMSKSKRYKALNEQVLNMRSQKPLQIDILGHEHLHILHSDVMLEAVTTSFQIHLKIKQEHAAQAHNISQIISAPLVAISANSPYVFGLDLWDESRIPLFEQAVDAGDHLKKRVTFDTAYVQDSLFELFASNQRDYPVLIPENHFDDDLGFEHIRLHNGTVWRWNRPLLGFNKDGSMHLRIENRVVSSGPTIQDMIANAAFYWGLVEAYLHDPDFKVEQLPFSQAKENFYQAAQHSLNSSLHWFDGKAHTCADLVLEKLLPKASEGLQLLGINKEDACRFLNIIEQRVVKFQNGALWQRAWVAKHGHDMSSLAQIYLKNQHTQKPVHEWDI